MMRYALSMIVVVALLLAGESAMAWPGPAVLVSDDPAKARMAIEFYRSSPSWAASAFDYYDKNPSPQLAAAIDLVASQKDAVTSRLYWYTDLEKAKAAAKAAGKPILSLRLLGKLTDELSCANSRFFRTVLYANKDVSKFLRENYILHWSSERPVPVITIDFGDGRVMKRTITGNSIHYVLSSDGRVVDALPGLYDPVTFVNVLSGARPVAMGLTVFSRARVPKATAEADYASRAEDGLLQQWQRNVGMAKLTIAPMPGRKEAAAHPGAALAMRLTVGKAMLETPMLRKIAPQIAAELDHDIDNAEAAKWEKIAALYRPTVKLDAGSIALIRKQNPSLDKSPELLAKTVDNFEKAIALDTIRNQFQFRRVILHWLAESKEPEQMAALNQRVYSELFLTPRSDPWLGLAPGDAYSALTADGCTVSAK